MLRADGQHNLDALALGTLNYRTITFEDLVGKGKNQKLITEVALKEIADLLRRRRGHHDAALLISDARTAGAGLLSLCEEMEFPLIPGACADGVLRESLWTSTTSKGCPRRWTVSCSLS